MSTIDNILDFTNEVKKNHFYLDNKTSMSSIIHSTISLDHYEKDLNVLLSYEGHTYYNKETQQLLFPIIKVIFYYKEITDTSEDIYMNLDAIKQLVEIIDMIEVYNKPLKNRLEVVLSTEADYADSLLIIEPKTSIVNLAFFTYDHTYYNEIALEFTVLKDIVKELSPLTKIDLEHINYIDKEQVTN
jgi:hypothetical protein